MEQWKRVVIDGIEYDYEVSDLGNVRNVKSGRVLKSCLSKKGYLVVDLYKNGKRKRMRVHRLVASMFIPNDDESKTQVNHKDEDKTDNRSCNLEWCTCEYNNNYGTRNERSGKRSAKTRGKKVMGISLNENKVIVFQSATQAQKFGFNQGSICNCCNNKYGKNKNEYKGYKWKYIS